MVREPLTPERSRRYWLKTSRLMWTVLVLWALLGLGIPFFADLLNQVIIFGFPLGYYLAAQGCLIAFVIVIFWYGRRQNAIDEDFQVAED